MSDFLKHYGTPRHSGRYPWGSGDNPYQGYKTFHSQVSDLKKKGLSEKEIAEGFGLNTKELRARVSVAKDEIGKYEMSQAIKLKEKGYSNTAIAKKFGVSEGTVRNYLKPDQDRKLNLTQATVNVLKNSVDKNNYIDIGSGVETHMGISSTRLGTAVQQLKEKGYKVYYVQTEQLGTGMKTSVKVLAKPGTQWIDVNQNKHKIKLPIEHSEDNGKTFRKIEPPRSVDSSRVKIRYAEDGGTEKDGVIELRRGVDDISLGKANYAQVRIAVDGTHYLKGMAVYGDNMPKGVDIIFNTNKHKGTPMLGEDKNNTVLKPMKKDKDNPFGATIKDDNELILAQRHYIDKDGKEQLSALNIVNEEGNWGKWSRNLSSQFLSKQNYQLAKRQLDLTYKAKAEEFEEINHLTNPVIKKKMLQEFADGCDAAAVHLKAAALPRQSTHVLLPFPDMKENEIYAQRFRDGEEVALIRYPHGGIFEIPVLKVNNKIPSAKRIIGSSDDAVGINAKVATQLSGADFDGDSVVVFPTKGQKIRTSKYLKELEGFDPKESYPAYEGMPEMKSRTKGIEMGKVSNLITDMTIKGATPDEIVRAVKHSMVVIDAEKHYLNYKQSAKDYGIAQLKEKYQGAKDGGASTVISRASAEKSALDRKEKIDPDTGKKVYEYTGKSYINKNGKVVNVSSKSTQMAETDDAFTLTSGGSKENPGTPIEYVYASHANRLKAMANDARKEYMATKNIPYSPEAYQKYKREVDSLKGKLNIAKKNAPLERRAQMLANRNVQLKKEANPDMDNDSLKRLRGQELNRARLRVGAKKQRVDISDKEWEAIQAGAIRTNMLTDIVNNTDSDKLKQLATPRTMLTMTPAKIALAKSRIDAGYSLAEVADSLGVSASTISKALK